MLNRGRTSVWSCLAIALAASCSLPGAPLEQEISQSRVFSAPLLRTGAAASSAAENRALAQALAEFAKSHAAEPTEPLAEFLRQNPDSPWRAALLDNLGATYRARGRFTKALDAYEEAWSLTRSGTRANERALANWALGELLALHSHLGHSARLRDLFAAADARDIHGPATEQLASARESLWLKEHQPEMSARCGPMALARIAVLMGLGADVRSTIENEPASVAGMSLAQLDSLAQRVGMRMTAARRGAGAELVVPSVVHWKVDHYSALIERKVQDGQEYFLVENPLFEKETWITRQALDEETSGYYLVPRGNLPAGWQAVSAEDAARVWGRCFQGTLDQSQTMCYAEMVQTSCSRVGMAGYNFHAMLVSLHIEDEPLGYTPPRGPGVHFVVTYNQREAYQPAVFPFANLGAKWTFDWMSYVTDSGGTFAAGEVLVYLRGGGQETYIEQSQSSVPGKSYTFVYNHDYMSHAQLVATATGANNSFPVYERHLPDGSIEVFGHPDNSAPGTGKRRMFLSQVLDAAGNAVNIAYDSSQRVVTVTDAIGQITRLSYELPGDPLKITKVTDPFGRTAVLTYNAQGQLAGIADVAGIASQFTYINGDFVSSLATPYGTTTFRAGVAPGADPIGGVNRSLDAFDPLGGQEHLEFRFNDPTAPNVYGSSLYWDKRAMAAAPGDVKSARLINWALDSHLSIGLRHYQKSSLESQDHYSYANTKGQLTTDGDTSGEANFVGLPVKTVKTLDDGSTQTYQAQYNLAGKPTQLVDPAGRTMELDYDSTGVDLLEVHNPADNNATLARLAYNNQHLPLTYTDAAGQTATYTYNPQGQLITVTNARKEATSFTYNAQGYLTKITGPVSAATVTLAYDRFGRVQTATDSEGYQVAYQYDALDHVTKVTYPDGTSDQIGYSNLDPVQFQDRQGRITQVAYDALRRPVSVTDPLGAVTSLTWCNCGDLTQITDANGNSTAWQYDLEGRVIVKGYADGSSSQYVYGGQSGRLQQRTDPNGQVTAFQYGVDDNVQQISVSQAANPTPTVTYTYDPKYNRLASLQDGLGTITFTYNAAGRLGGLKPATVSGPLPRSTLSYTYDELGRLTGRNVNGAASNWTYDSLGRVVTIANPLGNFSLTYLNATGRPSKVTYPNGQQTVFAYLGNNGDQRLQEIKNLGPGSSLLSQFDYTYATTGEMQSWSRQLPGQTAAAGAWTFGYDAVSQLVNAALGSSGAGLANYSYTYDAAGNQTSQQINSIVNTTALNNLNQVSGRQQGDSGAQQAFTYDADGNLAGDGTRTFEWDGMDRLTAVNIGTHRSEFSYDGLGRRVQIVEKEQGSVVANKQLVWCGGEVCQESDSVSGVTSQYFGQGQTQSSGGAVTPYYFTRDHLGSLREITDKGGNLVAGYDYDPYGNVTNATASGPASFGYAGYYWHAPSGLALTAYRAYDPTLGRWLSRDPAGEAGGFNTYAYANNSPADSLDPLGLEGQSADGSKKGSSCQMGPLQWFSNLSDGAADAFVPFNDWFRSWSNQGHQVDKSTGVYMAGAGMGFIGSFFTGEGEANLTAKAGGEFISVFHGSINNGANILEHGLDAAKGSTFVTRDLNAALDALRNHPDAVKGCGQIIESRIPVEQFNAILAPLERAYKGFWPYKLNSTEITLRAQEQFNLFNQFIVKGGR